MQYNTVFQMNIALGSLRQDSIHPLFRIQGQVYHLIGSIVPTQGEFHKFSKMYVIGIEDLEVATRSAI